MSVSPLPRQHAHTSLGAPNSSLRTRIPKATVTHRSPSRAGLNKELGAQLTRSRSTSPRPAPLTYNSPPARNRESIVASEDSHGQTIFLNVSNIPSYLPLDQPTNICFQRLPPRVSSLSRPPTRQDIPSSPDDPLFYQPPQPTYPLPHSRSVKKQRESMVTQSSGQTMSSLYPASSSSQTGPDSPPSPSTPSAHSSVDPVQTPGFAVDADDVSYRLRLLVRNNYFLPPAHSKPNQSELSLLSPIPPAVVTKTPSPTFRDLFRVGRPRTPSKAAPESPKNTKAPPLPTPTARPPAPTRTVTCPSAMSTVPSLREKERRGRVLVIRERIDDLVTAANSAEIDMRAREEDRRRREPPHANSRPAVIDVIDPTETVDLPAYQFPVQSSSAPFGGLAPDSSVGAATLADALPPRTEDAEDEAWRKALLHKAVGLSMLSIPDPTPPASQRSASASPRPTICTRPGPSPSPGSSGSRSASSSALPSPAAPPIGRAIVPGSRLSALPPTSPKPSSGIRSPGFATRSPVSKARELPIGSGSSPTMSLPPPPRARTASKTSLSPASASKPLSPALSPKSLSPASLSPSSPVKSPSKLGGRPSEGNVGKPSMLPVPKHTVRRALSTPMIAQKVGTAASNAVPSLPSGSTTKPGLKPSTGHLSRSTTPTKAPRAITPIAGSRVPTPSSKTKQKTKPLSVSRTGSPTASRSMTPSIPRALTPSMPRAMSPMELRAVTPSLLVKTPEGKTLLPSRDTVTSLTSGSSYSDDDEIVAVDDDEDEIIAVDDDDEGDDEQDSTKGNETEPPEDDDENDLRAPSRTGVMLRPDSRMTNSTVMRPSFTEGRTASRMSSAMSAFGPMDKGKGKEDPGVSSRRGSSIMTSRTSTLLSEGNPQDGTVSPPLPQRTSPPLNVRRSQVITPLTLQPLQPPSIASTAASLRSAPPPASTDFFDTVYTQSLEKGGPGFDSDSEVELEPPMPIFVQSRSRAVSTTSAVSSRSRSGTMGLGLSFGLGNKSTTSTVMHFPSRSNPYLATDPNPYQGIDPRKPVTNTPPASQTRFKGMGINLLRPATSMGLRSSGRKSPNLTQHPAIRAGSSMGYAPTTSLQGAESSHGHESLRSDSVSIKSRAARSEESVTSTRKNDPTLARLDDLYAMHISAERDQLKRIAAASRKPKFESGSSAEKS
ncbi:hypothetical protein RHS04_09406 [Rhizoctonia solani]|uniref:Uncharacterized protein n=1 Tax=Rhizoctonia solani TaxID=456999 RepID=A0A8H7GYP1_9AGAM|nr:hypothetical protein RHS04_09406 [Rhizoctonia solani]